MIFFLVAFVKTKQNKKIKDAYNEMSELKENSKRELFNSTSNRLS